MPGFSDGLSGKQKSRAPFPESAASSNQLTKPDLVIHLRAAVAAGPAGAGFFSGISATMASVVSISEAMDAAFCSAVRVTLVGSITPATTRSSYVSVWALKPKFGFAVLADLLDHDGAFGAGVDHDLAHRLFAGALARCRRRSARRLPASASASALDARSRATPPPGTMPSSTAARVACRASSTRAFFSFISVSVAAPTLITATPPASFASRSCSFSRS